MSRSHEALFDAPSHLGVHHADGMRPDRLISQMVSQPAYEGYLGLMEMYGDKTFAAMRLGVDINQGIGELLIHRTFPESCKKDVPKGHGEDVLLFPGLGGDNSYLVGLKDFIDATGSKPHFALPSSERNILWKRNVDQALEAAFRIFNNNGGRQITGWGHSAGGAILKVADEVAEKEFGKKIFRRIITAGSPLQFPQTNVEEGNEHVTNSAISVMQKDPQGLEMDRLLFTYLPEESGEEELFSMFSTNDPVVPRNQTHRIDATNIEIGGSHTGMAWNINMRRKLGQLLAS